MKVRSTAAAPNATLKKLKGIGSELAGVSCGRGLFRSFSSRRQFAAYAGLGADALAGADPRDEQGISKAGNSRLRTTMIQLAWLWVRHQPVRY
jgi:transposase